MIEALGAVFLPRWKIAAKRGEPAPAKPYDLILDVDDMDLVSFPMTEMEAEKFARGILKLICKN